MRVAGTPLRPELDRELEAARGLLQGPDLAAGARVRAAAARDRLGRVAGGEIVEAGADELAAVQGERVAADGARALADGGSPPPKSLERIEESGREALTEMRRLLGVLRDGDAAALLAPQPGVAQLPALAESLRRSGLEVELEIAPDCRALAPARDLCVYRIVQEALTNVLKHAQTTSAVVAVGPAAGVLSIQVLDDGVGGEPEVGGGHGLAGMRERAAVFGGRFFAGARGDRGFLVRVELPLVEA